jgi:hypothetical protein
MQNIQKRHLSILKVHLNEHQLLKGHLLYKMPSRGFFLHKSFLKEPRTQKEVLEDFNVLYDQRIYIIKDYKVHLVTIFVYMLCARVIFPSWKVLVEEILPSLLLKTLQTMGNLL